MLFLLRQIKHASIRPAITRLYSAAVVRTSPASSSKTLSAIDQLEHDGARILRTVQKRVEERTKLLSQISDEMSTPEDIKHARQAKELEPLKAAWDEWETNRQVRVFSSLSETL